MDKCKYCGSEKRCAVESVFLNKIYGCYCYNCGKTAHTFYGYLENIYFGFIFWTQVFLIPWSKTGRNWWGYIFEPRTKDQRFFRTIICRWRGHPYGVVWFTSTEYEPDMTCKNCGDNLG